ncbi:hypothetical protein LJC56_08620 [Christensenellaceae bacterium OttesenSCG-928-K19]|nr:hypothetical protein [Christensenellaceae bacterium OttesenSCG-928-K19]
MERNSEFISTEFLFEIATHANEWGARSIAFFMLEKRGVEITNETLLMDILAHITITENQKIRKILNAVKSQGLIDMLVTGSMPHYPQDRPIDPRVSMLVKTTAAERPLSKETIKQVIDNPNFRPEVRARVAMQIKDPELLKKIIFDPGEPSEVKEGAAQAAAGLGMENEIFDRCDDIMIRLTTLRSILPDDVLLVGDAELDKITNQNAIADVVTRFKNEYKFKQVQLPIKLDDDQVKRLMEKITDQRILARLFSTDTYSMVKDIALSCIMDQNVLYELSKNAGSHDTAKAIAKITDQGLLLELAQHHLGHDYNYTNRLDIQSNLFGIFKSISENAKTEELQELAEEGLRKFQGRDAFTDD